MTYRKAMKLALYALMQVRYENVKDDQAMDDAIEALLLALQTDNPIAAERNACVEVCQQVMRADGTAADCLAALKARH